MERLFVKLALFNDTKFNEKSYLTRPYDDDCSALYRSTLQCKFQGHIACNIGRHQVYVLLVLSFFIKINCTKRIICRYNTVFILSIS